MLKLGSSLTASNISMASIVTPRTTVSGLKIVETIEIQEKSRNGVDSVSGRDNSDSPCAIPCFHESKNHLERQLELVKRNEKLFP